MWMVVLLRILGNCFPIGLCSKGVLDFMQAVLSAEIMRTKGRTMQKLTKICSSDSLHFRQFIVFGVMYIISTTINFMHQLCFLYMLNIQISTCCRREREQVAVNMHGTVFTLARLKWVPSNHQELVSHPMPEHIEASLYRIKLQQPFPDRY